MLNDVKIIDDVFEYSDLKQIICWCRESPMFYRQGTDATINGLKQTRFSSTIDFQNIKNNVFIDSVKLLALSPCGIDIKSVNCCDAYINFYDFSTPTIIHNDYNFVGKCITVLYFPVIDWQPNWGGEILFYDKNLEATKVVSYRPNRFVIFDGSIPHCVKQPSITANSPRYSITVKFLKDD